MSGAGRSATQSDRTYNTQDLSPTLSCGVVVMASLYIQCHKGGNIRPSVQTYSRTPGLSQPLGVPLPLLVQSPG
ncbi:hypothetical protein Pmani_008093 [Petrolisthes manimaculis]|uniref:Uncharacterized protein n=1 Tax=Petrolisthes manimaculis TaxID=1843537 RepID=A0AAE1Q6B5_9EUCA|nr:hypothetical protein Pmani_008093 [Petrolisthes manimaculis]